MWSETVCEPGCETCWKREQCPNARAGCFCGAWQSKEPEAKTPDPNDLWRRGEDVDF